MNIPHLSNIQIIVLSILGILILISVISAIIAVRVSKVVGDKIKTASFGELKKNHPFSFIDNTVDPHVIRVGYIRKIKRNGDIKIFSPSLNKSVLIKKKGNNYFLI